MKWWGWSHLSMVGKNFQEGDKTKENIQQSSPHSNIQKAFTLQESLNVQSPGHRFWSSSYIRSTYWTSCSKQIAHYSRFQMKILLCRNFLTAFKIHGHLPLLKHLLLSSSFLSQCHFLPSIFGQSIYFIALALSPLINSFLQLLRIALTCVLLAYIIFGFSHILSFPSDNGNPLRILPENPVDWGASGLRVCGSHEELARLNHANRQLHLYREWGCNIAATR